MYVVKLYGLNLLSPFFLFFSPTHLQYNLHISNTVMVPAFQKKPMCLIAGLLCLNLNVI